MLMSAPEYELLLCCCRTALNPQKASHVRSLVRQDIDWKKLLDLAFQHGVLPLLYWNLRNTCFELVPKEIQQGLTQRFYNNSCRNLYLTEQLIHVLRLLENHGIPAIAFKGPVLSVLAYGNLSFREFCDLDILVHPDDVLNAKELLVSNGYLPKFELSTLQEKAFIKSNHAYNLIDLNNQIMVELHWRFVPKYLSFPLDTEAVWDNLQDVSLGDSYIKTMGSEDLLLVLCAHGAKHGWIKLDWICDVAELVKVSHDLDWQRILTVAQQLKCERMLYLGLLLVKDLLEVELPSVVIKKIDSDFRIQRLSYEVQAQLVTSPIRSLGELQRIPFHLKMIKSLQDRMRYIYSFTMTPTVEDWALLRLPSQLSSLYSMLRPLRLFVLQPIWNYMAFGQSEKTNP